MLRVAHLNHKKKKYGESMALFSASSSHSVQPSPTLVSGCQQTVALTFPANESFQFNDPFCRKNKKIAGIIGDREEMGCKRPEHEPPPSPYFILEAGEDTRVPLIAAFPCVCVSNGAFTPTLFSSL